MRESVCACVCESVCVERARERRDVRECVCVERERGVCVERERERESVYVCERREVCVRERCVFVCVCVRACARVACDVSE